MSSEFPRDLKYTQEHEWLRVEGELATVGITSFAAEQLGEIVSVQLPEEGDMVEKGEVFGSVESTKSVSDLFAPVSGKITRVNSPLEDTPEAINEDPYDEGWMIEIHMTSSDEVDELLSVEDYVDLVADIE